VNRAAGNFELPEAYRELGTVKAISSCVRSPELLSAIKRSEWSLVNPTPTEGDLVLARTRQDEGAFQTVDDRSNKIVRLYSGDLFIGVLGTRYSSVNPSGFIPAHPIVRNSLMSIVAYPGIVAMLDCIPKSWHRPPMPVTIEGFFSEPDGAILNLRHYQKLRDMRPPKVFPPMVLVAGTSAETGKTTLVCSLIRGLLSRRKDISIGAIKACGTGRSKDSEAYFDAGATRVLDFVDAGWPSTYAMPPEAYSRMLRNLLFNVGSDCHVVVAELGGDLLEACAPEALNELLPMNPIVLFCVNDAMGAIAGMQTFRSGGIEQVFISSFKQNASTLARRLGVEAVIDPIEVNEMRLVIEDIIRRLPPGAGY
jgi:hypothetical protein